MHAQPHTLTRAHMCSRGAPIPTRSHIHMYARHTPQVLRPRPHIHRRPLSWWPHSARVHTHAQPPHTPGRTCGPAHTPLIPSQMPRHPHALCALCLSGPWGPQLQEPRGCFSQASSSLPTPPDTGPLLHHPSQVQTMSMENTTARRAKSHHQSLRQPWSPQA